MSIKKNKARLLDSDIEGVKSIVLAIEFPSKNDIEALFTPKLENIRFYSYENIVNVFEKNSVIKDSFKDLNFSEKD